MENEAKGMPRSTAGQRSEMLPPELVREDAANTPPMKRETSSVVMLGATAQGMIKICGCEECQWARARTAAELAI